MSLLPNEVKTEHIANQAVTTPKIGELQVTSSKLQDGSVKTEKLAAKAVTGSKIDDNAITGSKIRDGVIRAEKIAAGAVTTSKIGELQVTGSRLQDKAVTEEKLANNAVTTAKIANGVVTPAKLSFTPPAIARPITPPVVSSELGVGSVTTPAIGELQVTSGKLQVGSVTTEKIVDGAVSPVKLAAIDTPANDEVPVYNQAQAKFEWKPMAPAGPAGAPGIYLLPATQVFYNEGIDDLQQEVDLSALVPAGATGVLIRAEHSAGVNMTAFAPLRVDGVGPADSFGVYLNDGDKYGSANSDNGIISLFNPATRTIRVRAPRTGQYTYAIVYLLGYLK